MAKYNGSGWHLQSIRHSNARKYGRAGGTYKKSIILGTMSSPTKPQIFMSGKDRIEMTYDAIDEMNRVHGTPRPESFGGRKWDKNEELAIYIKQVGERYTPLQWKIMLLYAKQKGFNTSKAQKELGKIYRKNYGKCENITIPRPKGLRANDLPIQIKMIVPSTTNNNQPIGDEEFNKRIEEVKKYFDKKFGADTTITDTGGYFDGDKWITEKGNIVESSTTIDKYKKNINDVVKFIRQKRKEYRQDSMFLGIEGRSYIIPNKNYIDDDKSVKKKPILVT